MAEGTVNNDVGGILWWRSEALTALDGLVHGFSSRPGGVSRGGQLNLAARAWDSDEAVAENWRRALADLDPRLALERLALVSQVHGAEVVTVGAGRGPMQVIAEADGVVSLAAGTPVAVRTADCVPVLLAVAGRGVAAVHAGWRGTAKGVVARGVASLCEATGAAPAEVVAAVGPRIAGVDYEVGHEVVDALSATGLSPGDFVVGRSERDRPLVDVGLAVRSQLHGLGVGVIEVHQGSTAQSDRWWSHRRDGERAGRQAAVIARWA